MEKLVTIQCDGVYGTGRKPMQTSVRAEVTIHKAPSSTITSSNVSCPMAQSAGGPGEKRCCAQGDETLTRGEKHPHCPYAFDFPHIRESESLWQPPAGIFPEFRAVATSSD